MNIFAKRQSSEISATELTSVHSPYLKFAKGDKSAHARKPTPPELANTDSLVYVSNEEQLEIALQKKAAIIIALEKLELNDIHLSPKQCLFLTPAINAAMALINPFFDDKHSRFPQEIAHTAQIHATAKIGKNVRIGHYSVIGENAIVKDNTWIGISYFFHNTDRNEVLAKMGSM